MVCSLSSNDALEYARTAPLDEEFIETVERLVMGAVPGGVLPDYAGDWDEAERLIARLGDQGVGVRLEFVVDENGISVPRNIAMKMIGDVPLEKIAPVIEAFSMAVKAAAIPKANGNSSTSPSTPPTPPA